MKRYMQTGEQEARVFDEEYIILNAETFTATTLNEAGYYCWQQLKEARSISELAHDLSLQYAIPEPILIADVKVFITALCEKGLICDAGE